MNLERYGEQVRIPLLISATVALIGGFALLNQGLYETIGRDWYRIADEQKGAHLRRFSGVRAHEDPGHCGRDGSVQVAPYLGGRVRSSRPHGRPRRFWPGSRVSSRWCCSIRSSRHCGRGNCWRRPSPISGAPTNQSTSVLEMHFPFTVALAISPLLGSLRLVPSLTKEQRDRLPLILETIGPAIIPALVRHLHDAHEYVRAVVAAALGHLRALEAMPLLAELVRDPSEVVRQSVVEALGVLASPGQGSARARRGLGRGRGGRGLAIAWYSGWRKRGVVQSAPRPHRAGRDDAGVGPRRRFGRGADPGGPGGWAGSGCPPRPWPRD